MSTPEQKANPMTEFQNDAYDHGSETLISDGYAMNNIKLLNVIKKKKHNIIQIVLIFVLSALAITFLALFVREKHGNGGKEPVTGKAIILAWY